MLIRGFGYVRVYREIEGCIGFVGFRVKGKHGELHGQSWRVMWITTKENETKIVLGSKEAVELLVVLWRNSMLPSISLFSGANW